VALGAAMLTLATTSLVAADGHADASAMSRVIQGLVTGIGFLGAGVITHQQGSDHVRGLTTAASIWVTAVLGILCGIGAWPIALIALALVFLLFVLGKPLERALHRRFLDKPLDEQKAISGSEE
jgi:putative Mg2+ transporter-C (MgtC) family protein